MSKGSCEMDIRWMLDDTSQMDVRKKLSYVIIAGTDDTIINLQALNIGRCLMD